LFTPRPLKNFTCATTAGGWAHWMFVCPSDCCAGETGRYISSPNPTESKASPCGPQTTPVLSTLAAGVSPSSSYWGQVKLAGTPRRRSSPPRDRLPKSGPVPRRKHTLSKSPIRLSRPLSGNPPWSADALSISRNSPHVPPPLAKKQAASPAVVSAPPFRAPCC